MRNWILLFFFYSKRMSLKQIFGNNLHSYRKLRGLSQEQLSERLDISVKHLSTMETGKVFASAELIEKIAIQLDVSISALFYTPDEKSMDGSELAKIDLIIEEEAIRSIRAMRNRIHLLKHK